MLWFYHIEHNYHPCSGSTILFYHTGHNCHPCSGLSIIEQNDHACFSFTISSIMFNHIGHNYHACFVFTKLSIITTHALVLLYCFTILGILPPMLCFYHIKHNYHPCAGFTILFYHIGHNYHPCSVFTILSIITTHALVLPYCFTILGIITEKSHPQGQNLTRGSASLIPGSNSNPWGEISLFYMGTHGGFYILPPLPM